MTEPEFIVDCECGLRYIRTELRTTCREIGHVRCKCGRIIGSWSGARRLIFEPEEGPAPEHIIDVS